jgi:deoxyadenosine/deoxycytidine kinase
MIISISGKIGSGKDTVGKIIQYLSLQTIYPNVWGEQSFEYFLHGDHTWESPWQIKKFAYAVKQVASILIGYPIESFEQQDVKKIHLGDEWNNMTIREMLQKIGTDAIRNNIHENAWVNALFANYKEYAVKWDCDGVTTVNETPKWIITDTRFPNELQAVKDRGGLTIRLLRTVLTDSTVASHHSETALDNAKFDWELENNGSIEELIESIKYILKVEGIYGSNKA